MGSKIWVNVKPKAAKDAITRLSDTEFHLAVRAAPQGGAANQSVVRILAEYFSIPKSTIKIIRGNTARRKLVQIG
jgi:uncharacterized protein (TIGR00251 family)